MRRGEASGNNVGMVEHAAADAAAVSFAQHFRAAIQWAINGAAIPPREREDIEQEVRIRLLRRFRRLGPIDIGTDGALGYAVSTALSVCNNYHRKRRAMLGGEQCAGDAAVGHDPLPDVLAERADMRERVQAAVMGLPPTSRAVMRDVLQGRSLAEIAEAHDVPIGTVKSMTHRARQLLRQRLTR